MMGQYYGTMMGGNWGTFGLFGIITWISLILFLVLGSIYFWKEINKSNKK